MEVLTVKNPYAVLIAARIKRVENRNWAPPPRLMLKVGQSPADRSTLYIHAGKEVPAIDDLRDTADWLRSDCGVRVDIDKLRELCAASAGRIVCKCVVITTHTAKKTLPLDQQGFFFGEVGWELGTIEPWLSKPLRGHLGIWKPTDAYDALRVDPRTAHAWAANLDAVRSAR